MKGLILASLLIFVLANMIITQVGAQQTKVLVFPESHIVPNIGLDFTVNITVQDVTDLYGWEFKLYYPNDILNGTSVAEGPFLKSGGVPTFFLLHEFTDAYNQTRGRVVALCLRVDPDAPGVNGSGVLATIKFSSKSIDGPKVLRLDDVKLSDSYVNAIPCTTVDGEVAVIPEFPAASILPLLVVLTSAAAAFKKCKHEKNL